MKIHLLIICSFILLPNLGCKKENIKPNHEPKAFNLPAKSAEVISKSNKFGIDLFTSTAKVDDRNLMLSPLSASAALTMLLNGSENNTYAQIQDMLGFDGLTKPEINEVYKSLVSQLLDADPEVKLAIANAVWYRKDFVVKPSFLEVMDSDFSAHVEGLDFALPSALSTMNSWASDNTFGKIPKVLDEISADAVMFLMNALYFKGTWTYQFEKVKTRSEIFYQEDGSNLLVEMMHLSLNANVYQDNNFKALELNYGRTNFSMIIILPKEPIENFYETFNENDWNNLSNQFENTTDLPEWAVSLPKFKFSYEKLLNDQLASLGMSDAFNPAFSDLSGIADADLFVDFVKQNTFVEVNEEGTEAAAVTTIGIELTSTGDSNEFVVNKPFIFAIRERTTNTILFIGKVVDPNN